MSGTLILQILLISGFLLALLLWLLAVLDALRIKSWKREVTYYRGWNR